MARDNNKIISDIVNRRNLRIVQYIFIFIMAVVMVVFIVNVNMIQGNAKVINFAGMVRGGTQKIVKEELYGMKDDSMIAQMDDLLLSLQTGTGKYGKIKLSDQKYQDSLAEQISSWKDLKDEIYAYRTDSSNGQQLFQKSQDYFQTADRTVSFAQDYSGSIENRIKVIEWIMIALISIDTLIIIIYEMELGKAMKHNDKLTDMAYIDPCTGLSNKRKCEERLSDPNPISDTVSITCLMFDINNLKIMNDEMGHEAGDELIAGFGEALRQEAIPHMFLGRFGGDEFVAIAVNASREDITAFIEHLCDNCNRRIIAGAGYISFAYGFAVSADFPGLNIGELMKAADQKMYENKKSMKLKETASISK